ncbi:MAG: glycosyltransferase family 2 protein [Thermodesulfovibrionales bacterium]
MTDARLPLVSVIILNHNGRHLISECLDALFQGAYRNTEVIVVDNGSTDGSVGFLREQYFGRIRLIENSRNLGFAEGNNLGFAAASGGYVALLNNDAVAGPLWLEELVSAALSSGPACGMWASKILFHDDPGRLDTAGHLIYPDGLNRGRGKNEPDRGQYDVREEVFFPSGCAALYRKEAVDLVGGFDPDFFAYGDDTDLGLKIRLAGWSCEYVPTAVVYHRSSSTSGIYSSFKAYLVERNRIWVLIKYFPPRAILASVYYTFLRHVLQAYGALTGAGAAGRFVEGSSRSELMKVLCRAYRDALRMLPRMLQKRRAFREHIRVKNSVFYGWLRRYRISAREIALKD